MHSDWFGEISSASFVYGLSVPFTSQVVKLSSSPLLLRIRNAVKHGKQSMRHLYNFTFKGKDKCSRVRRCILSHILNTSRSRKSANFYTCCPWFRLYSMRHFQNNNLPVMKCNLNEICCTTRSISLLRETVSYFW